MQPVDLRERSNFSLSKAVDLSNHQFIWRATLRSGLVILEQPGLSSDHLPRDEVAVMEYVPTKNQNFPVISCRVDLDKGERFVRYWTNVWKQGGGGFSQLYCIGIESRQGRFALLAFYPNFGAFALSNTKPFQPPWIPDPTKCLSTGSIIRGGKGTNHIGWVNDGFGGVALAQLNGDKKRIVFASLYE